MLIYSKNLTWALFAIIFFSSSIIADNFNYNSYNNHGVLGIINMPSARFYSEGSAGITVYDGTPDQKVTLTSSPYDWLEASFFYTNIQDKPYPFFEYQDYKDKGFNFKIRLKEEGYFPAIAFGINDLAGTGFFSSEYIVGSYGIKNLDIHFGLGWGTLNGSNKSFKNPLIYIHDSFANRPGEGTFVDFEDESGTFQPSRYFSDKTVSPFYGISYAINNNILLKIEHDSTKTDGLIDYEMPASRSSLGVEYTLNSNFTFGINRERDNFISLKFIYKKNVANSSNNYRYKKINKKRKKNINDYDHLIDSLEANGIGVNRIIENANSIGLELTQFNHSNLNIIEDIIYSAKNDSGIKKDIRTDLRIANLQASSNIDSEYKRNSKLIYERESIQKFNSSTKLRIRPYFAAREGFFKYAILLENNNEYIIKDNFFFSSNLKYSIKDNFQDLVIPPVDTYPAQVRSDVKDYLRNFNNGIIIGRAQFDYHITPVKNNHLMFSVGLLEEMFSGFGLEYLYFNQSKNYAVGFEIFNVTKRDYELQFGKLDYRNTTGFVNLYYRNYDYVPFDAKISYGEYLAGDVGTTFEFSRTYLNGAKFGVFATFTDVSAENFGEGSFDKGIFFNIPIYKNFVDYSWRPLTKDPGAKLNRKYTLHDLLIKFKSYDD